MVVGSDFFDRDMPFESGSEPGKVRVAVDQAELCAGLDHPGSAPTQRHRSVPSAFDVAGVVPTNFDHALDTVGAAQRAGQGERDIQPQHGEGLLEGLPAGTRPRQDGCVPAHRPGFPAAPGRAARSRRGRRCASVSPPPSAASSAADPHISEFVEFMPISYLA